MKKVCISTYCEPSSYGSVLQAIGLKKTLREIGFESFVVRDIPAPSTSKIFSFVVSANPKILLKQVLNLAINKKKTIGYTRSINYINDNVDVLYYNNYDVLCKNLPKADCYLAGSDQIWHPDLCKSAFFLDFVPLDKKRISYAASMGKLEIADKRESCFSQLISNIDCISVRELDMVDVIRRFTDKNISQHIDPTFLLEREYWRRFSIEYKIDKPYILVYAIYWSSEHNKELKKLHKKTGYDVVALCPSGFSKIWANKKIYDAGPGEFLYLIDHAEIVVSSSFHGVALALNFNKKIIPIINPELPSRISSLLDCLGVERLPILDAISFELSAYNQINKNIEKERRRAICYLKEVLDDA